ncbi:MAG: acetyl-CoA carboxylase biotin carboxyl carrier protein, partial [Candidatus Omnitrophica bacterium]|nr:acetyl-CoA carboxylase biotin carboxyl carrier protein [Candidatus Omnitrophota bacterium]
MNLKEIKELINLMNENGLTELELEREGTRIRIKKSSSGKFEAT